MKRVDPVVQDGNAGCLVQKVPDQCARVQRAMQELTGPEPRTLGQGLGSRRRPAEVNTTCGGWMLADLSKLWMLLPGLTSRLSLLLARGIPETGPQMLHAISEQITQPAIGLPLAQSVVQQLPKCRIPMNVEVPPS